MATLGAALFLSMTIAGAAASPAAAQTAEPAAPNAAADAPTAGATPDAQALVDCARVRVAARAIPPFIAYTQYAAFVRHGKVQAQRARVILRMSDGKADITPIRDSPGDRIDTTPVVKDRPLVYPTTTFGLVRRRAGESASAYESATTPPPAPPADGPARIGSVASKSRDYDPTLIGSVMLQGHPAYALELVPRFDPRHHPIRRLVVDAATCDPLQIDIEVWAAAGPVRSRPTVRVDYAPVDGHWLIAHAAMDFVLRFAFLNYGGSAEYRTSEISFPAAEPDWLFDAAALAQHRRAAPAPDPRRP